MTKVCHVDVKKEESMTQLLQMIYKDEHVDEDLMNNLDELMKIDVRIDEEEVREYEGWLKNL